jgi:excisionase family DNA binding protein
MDTRTLETQLFLQLLTIAQAAERLGLRESTIRAWVLKRKLAYFRVGGRSIRIPASEIRRILNEGSVPARLDRP